MSDPSSAGAQSCDGYITIIGGWLGALIHVVVAAVILLISDRFVKELRVNGFVGALVGAIALAVVAWLVVLVSGKSLCLP